MEFYAHTKEHAPWEPLSDHLDNVSCRAAVFANAFSSEDWASLAGLWHDAGKYSIAFQDYLQRSTDCDGHTSDRIGRVDHSTAGAQLAYEKNKSLGILLAYLIASHHGGLLNYSAAGEGASLKKRLVKQIEPWHVHAPEHLFTKQLPALPDFLLRCDSRIDRRRKSFQLMFWLRMLFSTLVDADFLESEAFMAPERKLERDHAQPTVAALLQKLRDWLDALATKVPDSPVNRQRALILKSCLQAAELSPGFFNLQVPTGGGKTLASLAFALEHAQRHGLRRVIIALPFTSIIEQNARVYREVFAGFGENAVVEHHSNTDPQRESETNRLQAENWDAPIIVTTNVQFFESLFAARTSRCRKVHNIAGSVIVLDEVQALPVNLLKPTLLALHELVENYRCTVVLSSATMPALEYREPEFREGLQNIRSIIADAPTLYENMRRTQVFVEQTLAEDELARRVGKHEQVLCVLNTRAQAADLFAKLGKQDGHYHLSTRMCGAHRSEIIGEIRNRLREGKTCRVISTQLIEAGVDLDFAAVYRARCGLDSLAQAAGRCNREGKRPTGEVFFFATEALPPPGLLRESAQSAEEVLRMRKGEDPLSPECLEEYYRLHFWRQADGMDDKQIMADVGDHPEKLQFYFQTIADKYRFIDQQATDIIIPWGEEGKRLAGRLRNEQLDRQTFRRLQPYCISLPVWEADRLQRAGVLAVAGERLLLEDMRYYDDATGIVFDPEWKAKDMII